MSELDKYAAGFLRMVAGWFKGYRDEDLKSDHPCAPASASAWDTAAGKLNSLAEILESDDPAKALDEVTGKECSDGPVV